MLARKGPLPPRREAASAELVLCGGGTRAGVAALCSEAAGVAVLCSRKARVAKAGRRMLLCHYRLLLPEGLGCGSFRWDGLEWPQTHTSAHPGPCTSKLEE